MPYNSTVPTQGGIDPIQRFQLDTGTVKEKSSKDDLLFGIGQKTISILHNRYDRLLVISFYGYSKHYQAQWLCKCDCGKIVISLAGDLKSGKMKSCGCKKKERFYGLITKHSFSNSPVYNVWQAIKTRCYNKNSKSYNDYGGRGIKMCREWVNDPKAFCDWALNNGWAKGLDIDRVNNNEGYSPENCRFSNRKVGNNNKRNNTILTIDGVSGGMDYWSEISGVSKKLIHDRRKRGWDVKKAVFTPKIIR